MKTNRVIAVVSSVLCIWLALSATACFAAETVEPERAVLDKLLKADEANDYDSFVADGDPGFKAGITKENVAGVSAQLSPRMKQGYQCLYLGELSQQGSRVFLWKLVFKDGGDDTLATLAMKDGKVAGFLLQRPFHPEARPAETTSTMTNAMRITFVSLLIVFIISFAWTRPISSPWHCWRVFRHNRFDLEQSIADWRKQMLAAGIKTPVSLEELEVHLREEIERQMKSGTNPQQAFGNSVQRIGHADELTGESKKSCGTKCPSRWSLLWTGVFGLVLNLILSGTITPIWNRVMPFMWHVGGLDSLSHPSWAVWLPNYVTFTTFTISGLVIGFARWHTKWTLLWISSMGLIGTMIVNLVCLFVFHGSDSVSMFLQRVDFPWWGFYVNWMIFIIMGLFLGLSNYTLWTNKLIKTATD